MDEEETKVEEDEENEEDQVSELGLDAEGADSDKNAADARTLSLFLSEQTIALLVPGKQQQWLPGMQREVDGG